MATQKLKPKQKIALELLTCGEGLTYKEIAARANVDPKTLYSWLHAPEFAYFQEALKELNDERWCATIDIARKAATKLCANGNQKMVEFVLKNAGYNPSQKVDASVSTETTITIEIGDDEPED